LCTQVELDAAVIKASKRLEKETRVPSGIDTLKSTDETVDYSVKKEAVINNNDILTVDDVFSNNTDKTV
jgi:hypothetical protein